MSIQEYIFKCSFRIFICGNLVLELINFLYSNKIYINQDKYKCIVKNSQKYPSYYFDKTKDDKQNEDM